MIRSDHHTSPRRKPWGDDVDTDGHGSRRGLVLRRSSVACLAAFVVFAFCTPVGASDGGEWDAAVDEALDETGFDVAGSALVVGLLTPDGGRFVTGRGEVAPGGPLPDGRTLFEIGSITKTFTTLLLAGEVVAGRIALDDPLGPSLPDGWALPDRAGRPVTFEEVATHTSGLPPLPPNFHGALMLEALVGLDPLTNPYAKITPERIAAGLPMIVMPEVEEPAFLYSNLAVGLLGDALAEREKTDYGTLVRGRVTGPLGMDETFIDVPASHANRRVGGTRGGQPVEAWDFAGLAAAGALRSTAADMLTYLEAQLGRTETPLADAIALTQTPRRELGRRSGIGLGWMYYDAPADRGGSRVWTHNGGTGGFTSFAAFEPRADVAVIVLSNRGPDLANLGGGIPTDKLGAALMKRLRGDVGLSAEPEAEPPE
ncbi:MAG: serine hydrolase domain-containing protein [Planctomycetota bacterium]